MSDAPADRHPGTAPRERSGARPSATWRVVLPFLAVFVPGIAGVSVLVDAVEGEAFHHAQSVLFAALTLVVLAAQATWLDRRPVAGYGFAFRPAWWAEFAVGAAIGVGVNALVLIAAFGLGWATVVEVGSPGDTFGFAVGTLLALLGYGLVALWEETLFRGILLRNVAEGLAARGWSSRGALLAAAGLTTAVFAVLHLNQVPSPAVLPLFLAVLLLMGGLFALAYVATGGLGLPIGLHLTANFAAASMFGLRGAWGAALPSLLRLDVVAPAWAVPVDGVLAASWLYVGAIAAGYLALVGWLSARGQLSLAASDRLLRPDPAPGTAGPDRAGR